MTGENENNKTVNAEGDSSGASKRRWGTRALGGLLGRDARKAMRQFGFHETSIITRWAEIVGDDLAAYSLPLRVFFRKGTKTGATLHIMVEGAFALQLQHLVPLIIEKVNMFYGYQAIAAISLHQGPVEARKRIGKKALPVLDASTRMQLDKMVDQTHDQALKDVLYRLGQRILGNKK